MPTLADARKRKVLSRQELAERAGVGRSTVQAIEAGTRVPHPSTRRRLAEILGIDPAAIDWPEERRPAGEPRG